MFSQQHYEALGKILKETRIELTTEANFGSGIPLDPKLAAAHALGKFQLKLQAFLKKDNPKFKELLFIGGASEHAPSKR